MEWYGATDLAPPLGFTTWKRRMLAGIDPGFGEFLRDDLPSDFRVEKIAWGGVRVDVIPALDNPTMIAAEQVVNDTVGDTNVVLVGQRGVVDVAGEVDVLAQ